MRFGDLVVERIGGEIPEMDVLFSEGYQQTSVGAQRHCMHTHKPYVPLQKTPNPSNPKNLQKPPKPKKTLSKTKGKCYL